MTRCITRVFVLVLILAWPTPADANHIHTFLGWSGDGTAYGYVDLNDGDGGEDVLVCRTDSAVPSPSWPAGVKQSKLCTGLSCDDSGVCKGAKQRKKLLATYLSPPRPARSGPQGETLKLRKAGDKLRFDVAGQSSSKTFELAVDDYEVRDDSALGSIFWRADGGAVAFELQTPGSGVFLFVRPLTSAAEPSTADGSREASRAANLRGMHLYKAQDWAGAAKEFRAAITADAAWPTPRYNLACVLGRQRDIAGATEQLAWLAKSSDPEARRRLEKGKLDEDLALVRSDARISALLGLGAAGAAPAASSASAGAPGAGSARTRAMNLQLTAWTDKPTATAEGENNDCQTLRSFKLATDRAAVTGSYEQGVVLFDGKGNKLATYGGEACLVGLGLAQLVPDEELEIVVHRLVQVNRGAYTDQLLILKRYGDKLVESFIGTLSDEEEAKWVRVPNIRYNPDGTIRYRDPDKKNAPEKLLRWNAAKREFLP